MIRFFFPGFQILLISLLSTAFTSINAVAQISASDYVTTWNTDARGFGSNQITIPAHGEYTVYYESIPAGISGTLPQVGTFTDNQTITFPTAGIYRVAIKPTGAIPFHRMDFNNYGDSYQFLTVEQWGTTVWSSMEYAYTNCIALTTLSEVDVPVLSSVTSMEGAFYVCAAFTGSSNMNNWDVSSVTNMQDMFRDNQRFNQSLGDWNVSNVTTMENMFWSAEAFNQPIDRWNVSNVTSMRRMFLQAGSFNQPLANWNTGNVTSMQSMFANADAFNQPLNNWNISNVNNFVNTFLDAAAFNQPLNKWTFNLNANLNGMLYGSVIDCGNYNTTLIGWAANPATPDGINIGVVGLNYGPPASAAHDDLVNNKGWNFNGDSFDASCTSLPVTLVSFNVVKQESTAMLTWSTTEETNSERFEIQRSPDAKNWKTIGNIASGKESTTLRTYKFADHSPLKDSNYYRLRMVDKDGTFAFSRMQSLEFAGSSLLNVYPNPVSDRIIISNYDQVKQISVFNSKGVKLLENNKLTLQGIDVSKLTPGIHTVRIIFVDGGSRTSNVVIIR